MDALFDYAERAQLSGYFASYGTLADAAINAEIYGMAAVMSSFGRLEREAVADRVVDDLESFQTMFGKYRPVDKVLTTILAETAPYYNIFSVLNVRHYETKLHTPFLRHLLDPLESHQQGTLFLFSFLKWLNLDTNAISDVLVHEELLTFDASGRMDIVVEYTQNDVYKTLVIENKIYAHDQPKQIERYHQYLV